MIKKVAILANGGDVSGFNAVIRAIVKTAETNGIECYGYIDGYRGLVTNNYIRLDGSEKASGILPKGGSIGGDSTQKSARDLFLKGINTIGVPKTIDNDVACTDITFGYNTAVSVATDAIDRLHTTAETHNRIMVLEVMGRFAGWIALESAISGGADVALIPEIPYDINKAAQAIKARQAKGLQHSCCIRRSYVKRWRK